MWTKLSLALVFGAAVIVPLAGCHDVPGHPGVRNTMGSYGTDVSAAPDMPIGSIGPTRARCLQKLRAVLAEIDAELVPASVATG